MEKDNTLKIKRLSDDKIFFNSVFKRIEKIVSVIFYILSETKTDANTETHRQLIKDRALKTHELALESLMLQSHEQSEGLMRLQYGLVALESTLSIAKVARVIPADIHTILAEQIDNVLRVISHHFCQDLSPSISEFTEQSLPAASTTRLANRTPRVRTRVNIPTNDLSSDAYLVYSNLTDRAERIKTVLEAKPQATIKDIAEIITDIGEKTIQRELNSLIDKGQVSREGERRWSRYSVTK